MGSIDTDVFRAILHKQLLGLSPEAREQSARTVAKEVTNALEKAEIPSLPALSGAADKKMRHHLKELRDDGLAMLGPVLSAAQVAELQQELAQKGMYNAHVWTFSDRVPKSKQALTDEGCKQACYAIHDYLGAPHVLGLFNDPVILKMAESYLGALPTVFGCNVMWSQAQPGDDSLATAQSFHRDWDNFKFCVLFVYLSDVDAKNGPHEYIRGTHSVAGMQDAVADYNRHSGKQIEAGMFYDNKQPDALIEEVFADRIARIEAPAGTAFMTDAYGLHKGVPPVEGERLMLWIRFGLYDNGHSRDTGPEMLQFKDFAGRMPGVTRAHQYIFRAILQSELTSAPTIFLHKMYRGKSLGKKLIRHLKKRRAA